LNRLLSDINQSTPINFKMSRRLLHHTALVKQVKQKYLHFPRWGGEGDPLATPHGARGTRFRPLDRPTSLQNRHFKPLANNINRKSHVVCFHLLVVDLNSRNIYSSNGGRHGMRLILQFSFYVHLLGYSDLFDLGTAVQKPLRKI